jgi:hypothetical protein
MEVGVEALECVGVLPGLRLFGIRELNHHHMFGGSSLPSRRLFSIDGQTSCERSCRGRHILDRFLEGICIRYRRNLDQHVSGRRSRPRGVLSGGRACQGRTAGARPGGIRAPRPVHLVYDSQNRQPLKLRAFVDFVVPRLRQRLVDVTLGTLD